MVSLGKKLSKASSRNGTISDEGTEISDIKFGITHDTRF